MLSANAFNLNKSYINSFDEEVKLPAILTIKPIPNDKFLGSSKLKAFADDNFKYDENGRKFFKWVENMVGRGEIACYEEFLLFPQCFLITCLADK